MLKDQVAVITGGTRGIGKAIATEFGEKGAKLALIATKKSEKAIETLGELRNRFGDVRLYACDVKEREQVDQVAKNILEDFKKVDILVNNAGITRDNLLARMSLAEMDDVIDVNLKGTMYMSAAFIKSFVKQRSGNIINISSVVGMMGNPGQANYAASKAGIIGFTKTIAKEYGKRNIRCNAIAPGYIETEMTKVLDEGLKKEIMETILLKSLGKPEDVAKVAAFLASEDSGYITGEVVKVDGGMYV